jgi:L,D-transpeptidase catalytic domain/Putative peptidoglycan binding domain
MRSKGFIGVAAALAIMCVLAGAVYAYDHGRRDRIAKGISVGGIDIGGMSRASAERKLEARLLGALHEPIVVHHGTKTWKLGPREARVSADLGAMIDDAVARSRQGNVVSRTMRGLTGASIHADLTPEVTFSKQAVVRLLDKIRQSVDRDAIDAKLSFHPGGFTKLDGRDGLAVDASRLHDEIDAAIVSPTAQRTFVAHTHHTAPAVTTAKLVKDYNTLLVVDRTNFQLKLFKQLKPVKTYDIAVGMAGLETPAGVYHIQNKAVDPAWTMPNSSWVAPEDRGKVIPGGTAANPLKARWLGIFDGAGIHGIDPSEYGTIGHAASHGCVRMRIPDVEDLYPRVSVGTPIYIG